MSLDTLRHPQEIPPQGRGIDTARPLSPDYCVLARINEAIIEATDAESLLQQVCEVFVTEAGYLCASAVGPGASSSTRVIAGAGLAGLAGGRAATAVLPLRCEGELYAELVLTTRCESGLTEPVLALQEQVADNLSHALTTLTAATRLRELAAQRRVLLRALATAEEAERVRIAGDIHDEAVQSLAAADLRLALLAQDLEATSPGLIPEVEKVQDAMGRAIAQLRDLLFELDPATVEHGLPDAVRAVAGHVFEGSRTRWDVYGPDDTDRARGAHGTELGTVEFTQALRIVKEALVNVRRHAEAGQVTVRIRNRRGGVEVEVHDDGVGGTEEAVARPGHRGLATMRDRAEVTGGWLAVHSTPPHGTCVRFWVPSRALSCPQTAPPAPA